MESLCRILPSYKEKLFINKLLSYIRYDRPYNYSYSVASDYVTLLTSSVLCPCNQSLPYSFLSVCLIVKNTSVESWMRFRVNFPSCVFSSETLISKELNPI